MEAIWNSNPNVNLLYCFEDGNCFAKLSDAAAYKKTTGADYKAVSRPTAEAEPEVKPTKKSNK
jgi:hypothetical protein